MKKKTLLIGAFLLLFAISLTGCGKSTASPTTSNVTDKANASDIAKEPYEIKLATQTGETDVLIADQLGYFKDENITVKYVGVLPPSQAIPAVLKGDLTFTLGHADMLGKAILAGSKLKAISTGMVDDPQYNHLIYFVKKGSSIKTAKDLIGKKIGVPFTGSCPDGLFLEWLKQNNVSKDQVQFVVIPEAQEELALQNGLVDVTAHHPATYQGVKNHGKSDVLVTTWDISKDPNAGTSFSAITSEKFLQEHPDVAKGIVRALTRAHHWINANRDEGKKITAKALNMKEEDVAAFYYDDNDYIVDSRIEPWFKMIESFGDLKPGQLKPSDIYTNDYNPYFKK